MRSLWLLLVAACLMVGCEEVPTTPTPNSQTNGTAGSNQQTSTATNSQQTTGHDAKGTIKDGEVTVQLPDGEIVYH